MTDIDLVSIARTGIDAEAFAKSDIGRFLINKAQAEIEAEMAALVQAAPGDVALGTDIRNRIHVAQMFLTWLDEAIQVGRHAHEQLQELDDLS